ncbi:MAG: HD domain-containing protein [Nitrospirae bacterium]|nr:HD domain-containing protein [Nitrospirota bacterium]
MKKIWKVSFFDETGEIINSSAYARYNKTQAFPESAGRGITRRWLHVQLVSYTARQISVALGFNESLAEAIALAHDLGHPPYGHEGEKYLNDICIASGCGCFAHNAQSARVLTILEKGGKGLNVSLPVVDGVLCHNGEALSRVYERDCEKTGSRLHAEIHNCLELPGYSKNIRPMALEGCVVRASDVIAYIGRDIEDAISLGLITRDDLPQRSVEVLGNGEAEIRKALINDLISESRDRAAIRYSDSVFKALEELLKFCYRSIYSKTIPNELRKERERMFQMLFQACCEQLAESEASPARTWAEGIGAAYVRTTPAERIAVDYIASMSDSGFEKAIAQLISSN